MSQSWSSQSWSSQSESSRAKYQASHMLTNRRLPPAGRGQQRSRHLRLAQNTTTYESHTNGAWVRCLCPCPPHMAAPTTVTFRFEPTTTDNECETPQPRLCGVHGETIDSSIFVPVWYVFLIVPQANLKKVPPRKKISFRDPYPSS